MSNSTDNLPPSPTTGPMGDGSGDGGRNDDVESTKRSERKRRREKQRRSDLSNAFDELAAFIVQVEPSNTDDSTDKKGKKRKSTDGGEDSSGITRLDLIGRALRIMKRLYRENEERKRVILTIEGRGVTDGANNDNVIVMVPTLAPSSEDPPPVARAAYPGTYHHSGASHYYPSAASSLSAAAATGNGHDPREYSMAPPPHNAAYTSHWGAATAGYGGRQLQAAVGLPHHLAPGAAMRLSQHQAATATIPGMGADGLPLPHINQPPGQH